MTIKAINKKAQKIMNQLIGLLNPETGHVKIENTNGVYMPVTVEKIGETNLGPLYSVAHYYEQNWDMMRDPEVVFQLDQKGKFTNPGAFFPVSYLQDNLGLSQTLVRYKDGNPIRWQDIAQGRCARFCNQWMENIQSQQRLNEKAA